MEDHLPLIEISVSAEGCNKLLLSEGILVELPKSSNSLNIIVVPDQAARAHPDDDGVETPILIENVD